MTPEEIDDIIEAMAPLCLLCASVADPTLGKGLCRDCWEHVKEHPNGLEDECTAADFAMVLGLTNGVKKLTRALGFPSDLDRLLALQSMIANVNQHTSARRYMLICRFCAFYLPALIDALVLTSRRDEPLRTFESFMVLLGAIPRLNLYFIKYFLSDDPRASNGKRVADTIAEQILVYASSWERDMKTGGDALMATACLVLNTILRVTEKPAGLPLPHDIRQKLIALVRRWLQQYGTPGFERLQTLVELLQNDKWEIDREIKMGLGWCARPGCPKWSGKGYELWSCARCRTVNYCGREHQREHWELTGDGEPGHKRTCYQTWF